MARILAVLLAGVGIGFLVDAAVWASSDHGGRYQNFMIGALLLLSGIVLWKVWG